jgi:hypothetical protein
MIERYSQNPHSKKTLINSGRIVQCLISDASWLSETQKPKNKSRRWVLPSIPQQKLGYMSHHNGFIADTIYLDGDEKDLWLRSPSWSKNDP